MMSTITYASKPRRFFNVPLLLDISKIVSSKDFLISSLLSPLFILAEEVQKKSPEDYQTALNEL